MKIYSLDNILTLSNCVQYVKQKYKRVKPILQIIKVSFPRVKNKIT